MNLALRHGVLTAVLGILLMPPVLGAQEELTVGALLRNADRYDGEVVTVAGAVGAYRERVTATGEPYTTFQLRDARASVPVFAWPHQGLRDGLRVRVTGAFVKVKTYAFVKAQRTVVLRERK